MASSGWAWGAISGRPGAVVLTQDGAPVSLRTLARLVNKSLLGYDRSRDRYELHELLRQYGAEKLADETDVLRDRHSATYCAALERWGGEMFGPRQVAKSIPSRRKRAAL